jgi:hypothetical protein
MRSGRYDHAERRRATRAGRQKGCSIYIAAEELERAGWDPEGPLPFYRVWGSRGGGIRARLYKDK